MKGRCTLDAKGSSAVRRCPPAIDVGALYERALGRLDDMLRLLDELRLRRAAAASRGHVVGPDEGNVQAADAERR